MIICFVGHSIVCDEFKVIEKVKEYVEKSIVNEEEILCYLGGYGKFDELCAIACRELKRKYPFIELVYVTPYISESAQRKIKDMIGCGLYDSSLYPPIENAPPRFAIAKRNRWLISNADLVIAYVNHSFGGAYKTLKMAKGMNKRIINICDFSV